MVKAYLRYSPTGRGGVITSGEVVEWAGESGMKTKGGLLWTSRLGEAAVLSAKIGSAEVMPLAAREGDFDGFPSGVTALSCWGADEVAIGDSSGKVRVFRRRNGKDWADAEERGPIAGHKAAVLSVAWSGEGELLASGSKDTTVVLIDPTAMTAAARLRGHTNAVTAVAFLPRGKQSGSINCVVSSSRDGTLRVWDVQEKHCLQVFVSSLSGGGSELIGMQIGSAGSSGPVHCLFASPEGVKVLAVENQMEEKHSGTDPELLHDLGSLGKRSAEHKISSLSFCQGVESSSDIVESSWCAVSYGKFVEVWRLHSPQEALRRSKRRMKRRREKGRKKGADAVPKEEESVKSDLEIDDTYQLVCTIRSKGRSRSTSIRVTKEAVQVALACSNNAIEIYEVKESSTSASGDWVATRLHTLDHGGHRTAVRSVSISGDDMIVVSCCDGAALIWDANEEGGPKFLRTAEVGYALDSVFLPDNKHIVVGEKSGAVSIIDGGTGIVVGKVEGAHGSKSVSSVLAVKVLLQESGEEALEIVTGGADKSVKVWSLVADDDDESEYRVSMNMIRTMTLSEDVLCLRISPNGKYIAASLLDSTIKIFFYDSFKFFVSLYGHSLPVLSMDVSSDGMLLASGGGDKNLRIWGMDFGDCHRSLRAHEDTITQVAFVPGTHYIFTSSKDRMLRYWDGDKFEMLLTLYGNHSEIYGLGISSNGGFLVTGGADRTIRRWERTSEPFFLEEERERRLDAMFEDEGTQGVRYDEDNALVATVKTKDAVTAADVIIDAIELAEDEVQRRKSRSSEPPNVMLLGAAPLEHVMKALKTVKASDLEQVLLSLPFTLALQLLHYLARHLKTSTSDIELPTRAASLLLRLHAAPLAATAATSIGMTSDSFEGYTHEGTAAVLRQLSAVLRPRVQQMKDLMGFNLAGLSVLQHALHQQQDTPFSDAALKVRALREAQKAEARERAIGRGARRKRQKRQQQQEERKKEIES